jgi:hypothetical protein
VRIRNRLLWFCRVVKYEEIRAAAGEDSTHRGGESEAVFGSHELLDRRALSGEARHRKDGLVLRAQHDAAEVTGQFLGKLLPIAGTDYMSSRIAAQIEGGQRDRGQERLEGAWRNVDDEPLVLARDTVSQFGRDQLQMPVWHELGARI